MIYYTTSCELYSNLDHQDRGTLLFVCVRPIVFAQ